MIIHVPIDIPQKARRQNAHPAKRNADQIHPLVTLRVRHLPRRHDNLPRRLVARDAGEEFDLVEQGRAGEGDGRLDEFGVRDVEVEDHGAADVVDGVGDEFGDEDVVVGRVADGAAEDADGEGEGGDGGDEVLRGLCMLVSRVGRWGKGGKGIGTYVWADDGGDDGCWDNDAADSEAGEDKETPGPVEGIGSQASKGADA